MVDQRDNRQAETVVKRSELVGIIIHYSSSNYGNHLVNLAARKLIESCGCTVELIVPVGIDRSKLRAFVQLPKKLVRLGVRGIASRLHGRMMRVLRRKVASDPSEFHESRRVRFDLFADQHLQPKFMDRRTLMREARSYYRIAIGSDQIWNYDYGVNGTLFGDFASRGEVVPLSPSVGHESIPLEWRKSYNRWLRDFSEIGTREVEWLDSLGPRPADQETTLLLDPTLMLARDYWDTLGQTEQRAEGKLLLYELGGLSPEEAEYIDELARESSLEVLHLSDRAGCTQWNSNAADFLSMIRTASGVITDSYHGAIFSFIFDKPLVLLERRGFAGSMNTRTRTFTNRLALTGRYMNQLPPAEALDHDYSLSYKLLENYRLEYWSYLQRFGLVKSN